MGLFGRNRNPAPASPATGPREIPPLLPSFYEQALTAAGRPVTSHNVAAVAGLTAANIGLNANIWLERLGAHAELAQWNRLFQAEADLEAVRSRPDEMIDFLWTVSPRLHPGLCDVVEQMHSTIVDACQKFGPELPLDMWGS